MFHPASPRAISVDYIALESGDEVLPFPTLLHSPRSLSKRNEVANSKISERNRDKLADSVHDIKYQSASPRAISKDYIPLGSSDEILPLPTLLQSSRPCSKRTQVTNSKISDWNKPVDSVHIKYHCSGKIKTYAINVLAVLLLIIAMYPSIRLIEAFRLALAPEKQTGLLVDYSVWGPSVDADGLSGLLGIIFCALGLACLVLAYSTRSFPIPMISCCIAFVLAFVVVAFCGAMYTTGLNARHAFQNALAELPNLSGTLGIDSSRIKAIGHMNLGRFFATIPAALQLFGPLRALRPMGLHYERDIPYTAHSDMGKLDWLSIHGDKRSGPTLLNIHGGGWTGGDKSESSLPALTHIASHMGWNVLTINYPLDVKTTQWPDRLQDCLRAVAWARENVAKNGAPLVVMGDSAGGHLAALVGLTHSVQHMLPLDVRGKNVQVDAVVDLYAYGHDLLDRFGIFASAGCPLRKIAERIFLHNSSKDTGNVLRKLSPLSWIMEATADFKIPPFLIVHGSYDKVVPVADIDMMQEQLQHARQRGCSASMPDIRIEVPRLGHAFNYLWTPAAYALSDFLEVYLNVLRERLAKI